MPGGTPTRSGPRRSWPRSRRAAAPVGCSRGSDSFRGRAGTPATGSLRGSDTGCSASGRTGRFPDPNGGTGSLTGPPPEEERRPDRQAEQGGDDGKRSGRGDLDPRLGEHLYTHKRENGREPRAQVAELLNGPAHDKEERTQAEDREQVGRHRDGGIM